MGHALPTIVVADTSCERLHDKPSQSLIISCAAFVVRTMDPQDFKSLLRQTVVFPVLLVAVLAGVLLWQIIYLNNAIAEAQRTQHLALSARQFLRYALDMETGLRGYLLTGDSAFLDPYRKAEPLMPAKIGELKAMVAGRAEYEGDIREIELLFNAWHDYAQKVIAAGPKSALANDAREAIRGKQMMDRIRAVREDLLDSLDLESAHRADAIRAVTRQTLFILLFLSAVVAAAIAGLIRRGTSNLLQSYLLHLDLERRNAADANETREWLMTTLRSMGEAVIIADQHGKVTFINPAAELLTGFRSNIALGEPLTEILMLLNENTRAPIPDLLMALDEHGEEESRVGSAALRRRDAQILSVEHSIAPIKSGKTLTGVVVILRDISERRRSEAALRSSERLSLLGRLSATIAHEIRNPLDAVMNLVYLMRTSSTLDETGRTFAVMAEEELQRIAQITHQLLAFNRESTKPVETNVSELVVGVLKMFSPKISTAGLKLRSQLEETDKVIALPGELRQVFSNLLANAIDVLPPDGVIAVKVSNAQEFGVRQRSGVRITIADNGPGIPNEVLASLFTPFFTTKGEKGTGLGLWVSRGIITKHEGTLRLRSATEGIRRGTVFSIFLPVHPGTRALHDSAA